METGVPTMIPDLLSSYGAAAKWAFPFVLALVFLYHFLGTYFSARVQQDWLNRLQASHATEERRPQAPSPKKADLGIIAWWKQVRAIPK
jgi:hypothetical protein